VLSAIPAHATSTTICSLAADFAASGQSCQELDPYAQTPPAPAQTIYTGRFTSSTATGLSQLRDISFDTRYNAGNSYGGLQFFDTTNPNFNPFDPYSATSSLAKVSDAGLRVTNLFWRNSTSNVLDNTGWNDISLQIINSGAILSGAQNKVWQGNINVGTVANNLQFKFILSTIGDQYAYTSTESGFNDGFFDNINFLIGKSNTATPGSSTYKYFTDLKSFQMSDQDVPAPLPLAGLAAAFGFSRKLRRRISSAQAV
jgi:hypothetical protein